MMMVITSCCHYRLLPMMLLLTRSTSVMIQMVAQMPKTMKTGIPRMMPMTAQMMMMMMMTSTMLGMMAMTTKIAKNRDLLILNYSLTEKKHKIKRKCSNEKESTETDLLLAKYLLV